MFFQLMAMLFGYLDDEEGAELAEYGLVLALVAIAAIVGLTALAGGINGIMSSVAAALNVGG